jgi:hypothetical protein
VYTRRGFEEHGEKHAHGDAIESVGSAPLVCTYLIARWSLPCTCVRHEVIWNIKFSGEFDIPFFNKHVSARAAFVLCLVKSLEKEEAARHGGCS